MYAPNRDVATTPGPWEYIASDEHHGPYVMGPFGGDICDCYTMSNLSGASVRNGGNSKPIHFQNEQADANARLIAAAPELYEAVQLLRAEIIKSGNNTAQDYGWPKANEATERALAKAEGTGAGKVVGG